MPNNIYLDVTELAVHSLSTGIQRVVRQIISAAEEVADRHDSRTVPAIAVNGHFHALTPPGLEHLFNRSNKRSDERLTPTTPLLGSAKRLLAAAPALYHFVQRLEFRRRVRSLGKFYDASRIQFAAGDRVVLIDSFWGGSTALAAARGARAEGACVAALIYDVIPLTHPGYCSPLLVEAFAKALAEAATICSGFLTNSLATASELEVYCRSWGAELPVRHFYLGANPGTGLSSNRRQGGRWPDGLWDRPGRVHLLLGTIEPRKGHATVLEGFEKHWREGRSDKLLIVGKLGWNVTELAERLVAHPERGRRLFVVNEASDDMLDEAFDRAHASIVASAVEGFGLPLVEALHRRVPVIASDIKVFREIAGNAALYFKQDDAGDLAEAVREMEIADSLFRERARQFNWIGWEESVDQFFEAVEAITGSLRSSEGGHLPK